MIKENETQKAFLDELFNKEFDKANEQIIKKLELEEIYSSNDLKKFNKKGENLISRLINYNSSHFDQNNYLINDISKEDFNKYHHAENQYLGKIDEVFSDNIVVFIPMKLSNLEIKKNKLSWKNDFNKTCRLKINEIFEKYGINVKCDISAISIIVYEYNENLNLIFKYKNENDKKDQEVINTKFHIKEILKDDQEINKRVEEFKKSLIGNDEGNLLFIVFKIGLADLKLNDFLNKF